jgi:predicted MFS family arabinose efflux permease
MLLQVLLLQSTWAAAEATKTPLHTYWVVVVGLVLGVVSAGICTLSTSFAALVVGRALQGVASAIYVTYTLIMMVDVYPSTSQTLAIAFFTAGKPLHGLQLLGWSWHS